MSITPSNSSVNIPITAGQLLQFSVGLLLPVMDDSWRERFRSRFFDLKRSDGLTQAELAEAVGVTQGTVANWLRGTRTPDGLATFERLATALGWHPAYLIYGITAGGTYRLEPDEKVMLDEYRSLPVALREWLIGDLRNLKKMPGFSKAAAQNGKKPNHCR